MNNATPTDSKCKVIENLPRVQRAVYDLLTQGGKYSVADISVNLHLSDPRGHIRTLRHKGVNILDEWRTTEFKARYKVYFLGR